MIYLCVIKFKLNLKKIKLCWCVPYAVANLNIFDIEEIKYRKCKIFFEKLISEILSVVTKEK